jgi:hypothetical protein
LLNKIKKDSSGHINLKFPRLFIAFFIFSFLTDVIDGSAAYEHLADNDNDSEVVRDLPCHKCDHFVAPDISTFNGETARVKAGDIICLKSSNAYTSAITFKNIYGTKEKPVIITNCGGSVLVNTPGTPFVLRFTESRFFRITGGNQENHYGIKLTGSKSNGLVMGKFTTNFEVDHLEVFEVGFAGIMAKTDPGCDDGTTRENFTMHDVSFHHNYIHDTHGEGFYIGHSSYGGKETSCGLRFPHTISNVKVYKNTVKNSGWDAIQVSSATIGAEIFGNIIENYATANQAGQNSGICIGGGTGGVCSGNLIRNGSGPGISVFGLADNIIQNNIIINPGSVAVFCDERTDPGSGYHLINNTIINPRGAAFLIYAEKVPVNNVINNLIVHDSAAIVTGDSAFIKTLGPHVKVHASNNFFTTRMSDAGFVNPDKMNFRLNRRSPLIDQGGDVSRFKIERDFYLDKRRRGPRYDIGASEH